MVLDLGGSAGPVGHDEPSSPSPARQWSPSVGGQAGRASGKWSAGRTLAFIVLMCGGFWIALGLILWFTLR